ncbi:hypothetical protein AUR04nite_21660 [Glutamicibacter uratoxydans]|uniref:Uncharacterized protein n=1 Tax=Glutamicibacter uratoxydans TaxID=43667 RepID=A0A4Y4DRU3_GLUUR|nr:hypothetical protein AUR04nite_21660 [Glutamicibacter uratoxydans]
MAQPMAKPHATMIHEICAFWFFNEIAPPARNAPTVNKTIDHMLERLQPIGQQPLTGIPGLFWVELHS